jgi:hypothetical protein
VARFVLPEASPSSYLRWLAFWREVEQRMIERPSLEAAASAASAPFISDEVARTISSELVPSLVEQARLAESNGEGRVAPVLEVERQAMANAVGYVRRRTGFLTPETCKAMGVEPLEPSLVRLRDSVVQSLEQQLTDSDPSP